MRRLALLTLAAIAAAAMSVMPAGAERLITSLSRHQILVTSSFTGTTVVLFGSIERDAASVGRRGGYDIVVTVIGPRQNLVTRRKERVFGIWANVDSRAFVGVPNYLAVLSNRPVEQIAPPVQRRQLQLGLDDTLLPQRIGVDVADVVRGDPFRAAFLRLRNEQGLYRQETNGVTFLAPTLFRANITLPWNVPTGAYEVELKLFADGAMIARTTSALEIVKVGFEHFIVTAARDHGILYGIATTIMALLTGWFASVVFKRD